MPNPVGALARIYQALSPSSFVKGLKTAAETDPRLQRAIEQGYDIERPMFHGSTYSKQIEQFKPKRGNIVYSGEPDIASLYTSYFDRPFNKRSHGQVIPLLSRDPVIDTGKNLFSYVNPTEFLSDIGLGGTDIDLLHKLMKERDVKNLHKDFRKVKPYDERWAMSPGFGRPWGYKYSEDPELPMEYVAEVRRRYLDKLAEQEASTSFDRNDMIRTFLEDRVVNKFLAKKGVPTLKFKYPTSENAEPGVLHGLIHDLPPDIWQEDFAGNVYSGSPRQRYAYTTFNRGNIRSPWAQFDPALVGKHGLMKYRGGLV